MDNYDVIIIGGGHAGIEAALAASRMGCRTAMITFSKATIGAMSCNPAIGGVGKGQLVKEIDALGGQMASAADACGIQFRILNASKGPAVHSSRAQIDMEMYREHMRRIVLSQENLQVLEAEVKRLLIRNQAVCGVVTDKNEEIESQAVVVTPGTFLDGTLHVGLRSFAGGRIDEPAATGLSQELSEAGFLLLRFKTGTCPRLARDTIDYSALTEQRGDVYPRPFSFFSTGITQKQVSCYITHTNNQTHKIIRDNLDRSPLYTGVIKATGVRYCPSIEDKIVKFSDKERHQIFLEPQGLSADAVYPNGLATSLPEDAQEKLVRSIRGLENARIIRFGYGIEHGVVEPTQLLPTLETKIIKGLYCAGQVNGTTGYEEAAAQGLIAGINAALRVKKKEPLILDRASSYIGVLIDDLTTKGTNEPYRMFTSRVEYRLILREDNADVRLARIGYELGLVSKKDYQRTREKEHIVSSSIALLKKTRIRPDMRFNERLKALGQSPLRQPVTLEEVLKRPGVSLKDLDNTDHVHLDIPASAVSAVEIEVKYAGFIKRQLADVERFKNLEKIRIPGELVYQDIPGISREIKEKLTKFMPLNLGQASRISGVTPAAISLLMVWLRKYGEFKKKND